MLICLRIFKTVVCIESYNNAQINICATYSVPWEQQVKCFVLTEKIGFLESQIGP